MNVSFAPYHRPSLAIQRIEAAMKAYSPTVITWTDLDHADLQIFPVTGRHDHVYIQARELKRQGRKYAILQLALKSTRNPNPEDWLLLWQGAAVVWSYYYLEGNFNFYHSALGADAQLFYPLNMVRTYLVGMTGTYTRTECLWEVEKAARAVSQKALKIHTQGDERLNQAYNQCCYISGLRRKEGFELPAAEGILAGARPILFDTPDFRYWYDGIAVFIPEGNLLATINQLERVFRNSEVSLPVSDNEIMYARYRFNWTRILKGFWEKVL